MVQRGHVFKNLMYNGRHTGIYYGVLQLVRSLIDSYPEATINICRDGIPIEKRKLYPAYKANRDEVSYKPSKDFCLIKNLQFMLATYPRVKIWYEATREADDLIASLAFRNPLEAVILSGDNDFLQLISKGIRVARGIHKGKLEYRTEDYILEKYKVTPDKLLLFRCLQGDKSDNITGVLSTTKIRKIINNKTSDIISSLEYRDYLTFKRNLSLMSLSQFRSYPIHTQPLQVVPDQSLFTVFGLEKLIYED